MNPGGDVLGFRAIRQLSVAELDLFGEVPVTRTDVYAWLLTVGVDPASFRALRYVESYAVLDKVTRAKSDGSFQRITAAARDTARFRELVSHGTAVPGASNVFGVGEVGAGSGSSELRTARERKRRTPREIAREREQAKVEKRQRRKMGASILNRVPKGIPSFSVLLKNLGEPDAETLAASLRVCPSTARRWLKNEEAPFPVLLALFWLTRWGVSVIDADAFNDAIQAIRIARLRESEAAALRARLQQVERIADFGSANDPLPSVGAAPSYPIPPHLQAPVVAAVPLVFTSIRKASCVESKPKKKRA